MSVAASKPKRRRLNADARRERILEAAMRVFADQGYERASFGAIAKLAGISRPVVYDHFGSKEELHLLLLERERDRILEQVKVQLVTAEEPAERVARALDAFFSYVETHPYAWRMLFRESAGEAAVADAQRRIQGEAHLAVANLLAKEKGSKILTGRGRELRLEMLAALWGSATNGLARWWYDRREVPRRDVVAASMDALWLGVERLREGERWRGPSWSL